MLINKGVSEGEVVTMKLMSGEEVLSRLVSVGPMSYRVSKPMVLTMGPQGVGMIPYMITSDPGGEVEIKNAAIAAVTATEKGPADQYVQTTTGIKMV
jgi:hypothetical protein